MKKERFEKGLFILMMAVLVVPFAQHCTDIITSQRLQGDYDVSGDTRFTKQGWIDGTYQEQKNKYLNDNMGLRADFVRAGIQVDFTLFRRAKGKWVGKEDYLYYTSYIDAYTGKDFMGHDRIRNQVLQMRYLQDRFRAEGKTFLFVIAGSKVEHYPEYLPEWPEHDKVGPTNRAVYGEYCDSLSVNIIDFNGYLLELKKANVEGLFSKQGVHWTRYGAMFAVDSIIRFIERDRNIDLPNPDYSELEYTTVPRGRDNDMGESLNLPIPIKENFIYPVIRLPRTPTTTSISSVYVGDSFFWTLQDDSLTSINHDFEFWYYFTDVFREKENKENDLVAQIETYDWKQKLDSTDCVIVIFTAHNLPKLDKFINATYDYYKQKGSIPVSRKSDTR